MLTLLLQLVKPVIHRTTNLLGKAWAFLYQPKKMVDSLGTLTEDELQKSDEFLDRAESMARELLATIEAAKDRRHRDRTTGALRHVPGRLPAELAQLIANSSFLPSKDLGRFLLTTNKSITAEFEKEYIWTTILQCHSQTFDPTKTRLQSLIEKKGCAWMVRQLARESDIEPEGKLQWEVPTTTLSSNTLIMVLSLRDTRTGSDFFTTVVPQEEVEGLYAAAEARIPFQMSDAFANLVQESESPPLVAQLHCFRSDTHQCCCLLSSGPEKHDHSDYAVNDDGTVAWRRMQLGAAHKDCLKVSLAGHMLLTRWYAVGLEEQYPLQYGIRERAGLSFCVDIHFAEDPYISIDVSVDACGAVNTMVDSTEGISLYTVMDTLVGWK